jgi:membrane-associated phospholipid phosphatase
VPRNTDDHPFRSSWPIHRRQALLFVGAYLGLTAIWSVVGWTLTHPLKDSAIARADERIARWFAGDVPWLNSSTRWGGELAGTLPKVVVTTVIAVAMLLIWKRWFETLVVGLALALEAACFITTTTIVGRPRPPVRHLENSPVGSSFPSGHTAAAAAYGAIAVVIFWHSRRRIVRVITVVVLVAVCAIVSLSRMYRGMHYLTDVIAGLVLGATCVAVSIAILRTAPEAAEIKEEDEDRTSESESEQTHDEEYGTPVAPSTSLTTPSASR